MQEFNNALQVCTEFSHRCVGCPIAGLCTGTTIDSILERLRIMDSLAKNYLDRKETKRIESV